MLTLVRSDLREMPARSARFTRCLTLAPCWRGSSEDDLRQTRQAVSKLVNSLSWHRRVTVPATVGPEGVVLRLDLRDYLWNARPWDRLGVVYPYRVGDNAVSRELAAWTGTELPVLRADWFLFTASRPPFYHDFLQLPVTDRDTERLVRVDVFTNWQGVARSASTAPACRAATDCSGTMPLTGPTGATISPITRINKISSSVRSSRSQASVPSPTPAAS
jgi:hypothetical protein